MGCGGEEEATAAGGKKGKGRVEAARAAGKKGGKGGEGESSVFEYESKAIGPSADVEAVEISEITPLESRHVDTCTQLVTCACDREATNPDLVERGDCENIRRNYQDATEQGLCVEMLDVVREDMRRAEEVMPESCY